MENELHYERDIDQIRMEWSVFVRRGGQQWQGLIGKSVTVQNQAFNQWRRGQGLRAVLLGDFRRATMQEH